MSRLRLLLGSFLKVPDQESPHPWKLSKGNPHWAEQPCHPRSKGKSSEQKARPVGNKKELPNFNKAGIKVNTAGQKSCQEDVHRLARDNSERKVKVGLVCFIFTPAEFIPVTETHLERHHFTHNGSLATTLQRQH